MVTEATQIEEVQLDSTEESPHASRLEDLVAGSEDWLMTRILEYAKKRDYVKYTSTLTEAWRLSISGLSQALLSAFREGWPDLELSPDDAYDKDLVASFGVIEARRHRERGVDLGMFLGLMKYYRQTYLDLIRQADFEQTYEEQCRLIIERFFDRVEIGFCTEWASDSDAHRLEELRSSNRLITNEKNKYLTIFESQSNPIILLDRHRRIDNINQAASTLFEKSHIPGAQYYCRFRDHQQEARGDSHPKSLECLSGVQGDELLTWMNDELEAFTASTDQVFQFQKEVLGEGRPRYFSVSLSKMLDVSGKFCGTIVSLEDITAWNQAQAALRQSEEKYRTVLEGAPVPTVVYDMSGKVTYLNPAFADVFGWTLHELSGRIVDYVPEENWPETQVMVSKVVAGESFSGIETRRLTKAGDILDVSVSGAIYRDTEGHPIGSVINLQNITERKKLEAQLLQTQKMEALGTLSGGIAHDFNNLLMAIQWNVSLLYKDIAPDHPRYKVLRNIEERVESGANLTAQLLGYARQGKFEVNPLGLNELVKDISETFGRARKDITIKHQLEGAQKVVVADRGQLEQMLLNLYINASEAMISGGVLFVKTANVKHQDIHRHYDVEPGQYVKLTVSDTGTGMQQETVKRVFDPFFTTKKSGHARGLGLASVYGIVKSHGGYIDVESEKGRGATFHMYLPATDRIPDEIVDNLEGTTEINGIILLVDDEQMVREIGSEALQDAGYSVLEAGSGREAVQTYGEKGDRIDLVILDIVMPDMNGGEVFDRIREINPDAKVLLSSGYSIEGQATDILDRGCNGFIQKPFRMQKLYTKIRKILESV